MGHGAPNTGICQNGVRLIESKLADIVDWAAQNLKPRIAFNNRNLIRRNIAGKIILPRKQAIQATGNLRHLNKPYASRGRPAAPIFIMRL